MNTRRRAWSNLPNELLTIIGERLDTRIDNLRFRAVCTSWRSTIPLFQNNYSRFPLKHPDTIDYLTNQRGYLALTDSTVFRLEPSDHDKKSNSSDSPRGWLVKIEESKPGKIRLLNPVTDQQIRYNPETFPKMLNLLDYRVFELSIAYKLEYVDTNNNHSTGIKKVIFSPYYSSVLVIYDKGKLAFLRLGDVKWTPLGGRWDPVYLDIILYGGRFYAIDKEGQVIMIDPLTMQIIKISCPLCSFARSKKKFVQSCGDLYVFNHTTSYYEDNTYLDHSFSGYRKHIDFEIYKLNVSERDWVKMKSLVDVAVFLGDVCSFSVFGEELDGCSGNCIYFRDEKNIYYHKKEDGDVLKGLHGHDISLVNLEDSSISGLATCPGNFQAIWPSPDFVKA